MKLFNLTKSPKEGCEAARCKEVEVIEIPGELWGRESVNVCIRHAEEAEDFAKANPDYTFKPPTRSTSLAVVDDDLDAELKKEKSDAESTLEALKDYEVETQEQLEEVGTWLQEVKARRDILETREKEITGPIQTSIVKVRALFKPVKEFWANVEVILKQKIAQKKLKEEQENQAALDAAAQAHEAGDTSATQGALSRVTTVGDLSGISTHKKWIFKIVDAASLPREYLIPNEKKIREHCAKFKHDQIPDPISGVKFTHDVTVSARTAS